MEAALVDTHMAVLGAVILMVAGKSMKIEFQESMINLIIYLIIRRYGYGGYGHHHHHQ